MERLLNFKNCFLIILFLGLSAHVLGQVSIKDQQTLIQMSIDHEDLQKYFERNDTIANNTLIIYNNGVIPDSLKLIKFGKQVLFMTKEDLFFNNVNAHLIFHKFEVSPTEAVVEFSYDIGGVNIKLSFQKGEGVWKLKKKKLTEN